MVSAQFKNTGYVTDYYRYKYNMEYKSVVMPLMLQYSFFNDKTIQPYVGLGVGVHFTNNYTGYVDSIHESTSESTRSALNKPSATETSFRSLAGVNLKLSRFLIGGGVMYESMHSPLNFRSFGTGLNATQANVAAIISVALALKKLMPDPTFSTIPHFVSRAPLGNTFVTEIARIGVLRFRELLQDTLFVFGSLFYPLIEFVAGSMLLHSVFSKAKRSPSCAFASS